MAKATTTVRKRLPADERRKHLLDVARDEFARNGYRSTTTLAVADAAGVSEGLVLKHFGSKQELFRAAVAEPLLDVLRDQATATGADTLTMSVDEIAASLTAFFTRLADVVRAERNLLPTLIGNLQEFPDVAAELTQLFRQQVDALAGITDTVGKRRPEFRNMDAQTLTYASMAAATMAGLVSDDPKGFVEHYVNVLMLGVLTPAGRRKLKT